MTSKRCIIWQAPRAGKTRRILCSDWLPERARWSDTARPGLPVSFPQQNFAEVQAGAQKFSFAENIFCSGKKIFCDFFVFTEPENGKTESVNVNENKENKNVDEFQEYVFQQKPANTKVKAQNDMKAWKRFCLQQQEIGNCVTYLKTSQIYCCANFSKL